jgi:hypothetical protein
VHQLSSGFPIAPLIAVVFVGLMAIAAIYGVIQTRRRREALFELAQRLNLEFDAGDDREIAGRFSFLKQLAQGSNRYATNVLSGNYQQNEILAFDYHYETYTHDKNGTRTEHHWFSFFILTLPAAFSELTIRREGFFTKIAEVFGYGDINFESAEFSRAFNVRSPDKKFAYDVCNAQMMEYLLANRDLSIEIENDALALAFTSRLSVEEIEANLQRLVEIRTRLPQYLFTNS